MRINEIQCKSILTKSNLPEADYVINPYTGCGHACRYCYASFMRRFTGHGGEAWGSFVDVKVNAAEMLETQLTSSLEGTVLFGSVTDCYMPLERKYKLSRKCLEVFIKKRGKLNVSVLTKGALITRDVDLLRAVNAEVGLTITTHDTKVARTFEPGASSPLERAKALTVLHDAGIPTYVFIGPILPGLTDFNAILHLIKGSVDSVMGEVLNFRGCATNCEKVVASRYPSVANDWSQARRDPLAFAAKSKQALETACKDTEIPLVGFYAH